MDDFHPVKIDLRENVRKLFVRIVPEDNPALIELRERHGKTPC